MTYWIPAFAGMTISMGAVLFNCLLSCRRHGIHAAVTERMAAQQAPQCQPAAAQRAVGVDSLARIRRAARIKPALAADKRAQAQLINADGEQQQAFHRRGSGYFEVASIARRPEGSLQARLDRRNLFSLTPCPDQ